MIKRIAPALLILTVAAASCARHEGPAAGDGARAPAAGRNCVNLNTAGVEELMSLPGVGEATSRKIIEHRERNGKFRRAEDIIILDGFSDKKYREIAELICAY